jgi:hypothetical protein
MKKIQANVSIIIPIVILILASIGLFLSFGTVKTTTNSDLISWISIWVAIANTILLYATLSSQNKGLKNQRESFELERFETTFFNLLENHRKQTEKLSVSVMVLKENLQIDNIRLEGRSFFSFAIKEIAYIQESLKSKYYSGQFDEQSDSKSIDAIEQNHASIDAEGILYKELEKKLIENYNHHRTKFANLIYNISKDEWNKIHNSNDKETISVDIFYKTMFPQYNHYIRSLNNLLDFAKRREGGYLHVIISQMSDDELSYISHHALIDNRFKDIKDSILRNRCQLGVKRI